MKSKNILVAPLNWGLGHATRCIPVINALIEANYNPIIASDGVALEILKIEFPNLLFLELPSYHIKYAKKASNFKLKILKNIPKMIAAIANEKEIVKQWIKTYQISGIISDNRLGVYSKKIPSVFISHQINVLSGNTSWLSSKFHQKIIKKFTVCWVPDNEGEPNLTGNLGHLEKKSKKLNLKYIGPLSRLRKIDTPIEFKLMIILSGPDPQRGMLEKILVEEVLKFEGKVLFVKGKIEEQQKIYQLENTTFYNYMTAPQIEKAFNESEIVLCRSGYTTIMDLAKLGKKAFFIPTPGQFEQEYLAKKFQKDGIVPYCKQDDFSIELLKQTDNFIGLTQFNTAIDFQTLFEVFEI